MKKRIWNFRKTRSGKVLLPSKILLFLSSHIKYTIMLREALRILASKFFFLEVKPLTALLRVAIRLVMFNQALILFQREDVQVQPKNKWPWLSSSCVQKVQNVSVGMNLSLSLVRSFPSIASHNMKLHLGRDHCSQTIFSHGTVEPLVPKRSIGIRSKSTFSPLPVGH